MGVGDGVFIAEIITFLFYEAKNHYSPSHLCMECLSSGTREDKILYILYDAHDLIQISYATLELFKKCFVQKFH